MYKALIIGCGNIGAGYDLQTDEVLTHARAFSLCKDVHITFADLNRDLAKQMASTYKGEVADTLTSEYLQQFTFVSICTSTSSHLPFIRMALDANVPVVLCEKPITNDANGLVELSGEAGTERILVNYIRRFQPAYAQLKEDLEQTIGNSTPIQVRITYTRGLLNNAGHAIDLLNYLFGIENFKPGKMHVASYAFDAFADDPTLSGFFSFNEHITVQLTGIIHATYNLFEIEFYTPDWSIKLTDSGETVTFFKSENGLLVQPKTYNQQGMLSNYMNPVITYAFEILQHKKVGNFESAYIVNQYLLNEINKLKHGK